MSATNSHPPLGVGTGRIFETHIETTDLERAKAFYGDMLGLELAHEVPERGIVFYWVGGRGNAMLGVWLKTPDEWRRSHFAFEIMESQVDEAIARLRAAGVTVCDFFGNDTDDPSVHAWMPAAGIFFRDPDGNNLEFLAMLPDAPRFDVSHLPLSVWRRERARLVASV